jgi:hypothetical protein
MATATETLNEQLTESIKLADATPAILILTPSPAILPEPEAKPVTITLPAKVHAYFKQEAEADDRTLNQFIARFLTKHHKSVAS